MTQQLAKKGLIPFLVMVFLNAFVDLGHKIIVQNTIFKIYDGQLQILFSAVVNGLILLPFIFLFTPAGFISDKYQKTRVMRLSAWLAVMITLLITAAYYAGLFSLAFALTFVLAMQSAIYSPAKYGFIKQISDKQNLSSINGAVQATTIIAILSGTLVFSGLFEVLLANSTIINAENILITVAPLGWGLVILSVFELLLAYRLPNSSGDQSAATESKTPTKMIYKQQTRFSFKRYLSGQYLRQNCIELRENRTIWLSIAGLSVFWALSQVLLASFPAFAKETLGITNTLLIQGVLACSGIGIILGSIVAARFSKHYIEKGLIAVAAIGITSALFVLPSCQSVYTMAAIFICVGFFGGLMIIPLNALIQHQAKEDKLGTILAGNNWIQNIVMALFLIMTAIAAHYGMNSERIFKILFFIALIGTVFTLREIPHAFARTIALGLLKLGYRINIEGFENLPEERGVLLVGNHVSWIDWVIVQAISPRPVRFIMARSIYQKPLINLFFRAFGAIPIEAGNSQSALKQMNHLLRKGEVVCIFPEGCITKDGHLSPFKSGYERGVQGLDQLAHKPVILPFFLDGLWGSQFSKADRKQKKHPLFKSKRQVLIHIGQSLPLTIKAAELKQNILALAAKTSSKQAISPA
jgi:acyl-[acyl-carrier-protein]-phospholipid O-acyltransferase/long-chain-fatty-acid--[acyl-carrier-protein] ligase